MGSEARANCALANNIASALSEQQRRDSTTAEVFLDSHLKTLDETERAHIIVDGRAREFADLQILLPPNGLQSVLQPLTQNNEFSRQRGTRAAIRSSATPAGVGFVCARP
jgi:hypothetical protein